MSLKTSRIVQVSAYYPPHLGGQEIAVQGLATQLALTGKQVEVVTSDRGAKRGVDVENGVRVTRLRSNELGHTAIIWGLVFWLLKHTKRDTIVHVHVGQFFTPEAVWLVSKLRRFRYIIHMHCDLVQSGPMGKFLPLYKRLVVGGEIRDAEVVVVLNNKLRQTVERDYGYAGKLAVMSNGIDEDFFRIIRRPAKAETLKLLFVGRLSPHKNLTVLLEALSVIKQGVEIDIIGDGECRHALELNIKDKNLKNVRLHGRLSRDEIMGFYSMCDALILPSIYEVQPIVLLEAMASRIPIITTKGIGMEVGTGEAILIEPTAQGIVDGIEAFAAMSSNAKGRLVETAFKRAGKLGWSTLITSYSRLYEEVAEDTSYHACAHEPAKTEDLEA
jgi:glycosyltransferase involved in cell wall biosynthesis